jgi:hypothetical protein
MAMDDPQDAEVFIPNPDALAARLMGYLEDDDDADDDTTLHDLQTQSNAGIPLMSSMSRYTDTSRVIPIDLSAAFRRSDLAIGDVAGRGVFGGHVSGELTADQLNSARRKLDEAAMVRGTNGERIHLLELGGMFPAGGIAVASASKLQLTSAADSIKSKELPAHEEEEDDEDDDDMEFFKKQLKGAASPEQEQSSNRSTSPLPNAESAEPERRSSKPSMARDMPGGNSVSSDPPSATAAPRRINSSKATIDPKDIVSPPSASEQHSPSTKGRDLLKPPASPSSKRSYREWTSNRSLTSNHRAQAASLSPKSHPKIIDRPAPSNRRLDDHPSPKSEQDAASEISTAKAKHAPTESEDTLGTQPSPTKPLASSAPSSPPLFACCSSAPTSRPRPIHPQTAAKASYRAAPAQEGIIDDSGAN